MAHIRASDTMHRRKLFYLGSAGSARLSQCQPTAHIRDASSLMHGGVSKAQGARRGTRDNGVAIGIRPAFASNVTRLNQRANRYDVRK